MQLYSHSIFHTRSSIYVNIYTSRNRGICQIAWERRRIRVAMSISARADTWPCQYHTNIHTYYTDIHKEHKYSLSFFSVATHISPWRYTVRHIGGNHTMPYDWTARTHTQHTYTLLRSERYCCSHAISACCQVCSTHSAISVCVRCVCVIGATVNHICLLARTHTSTAIHTGRRHW